MKKQKVSAVFGVLLGVLLLASPVMAQDSNMNPGVTPNQEILWGLDILMEKIQIGLTLDPVKKISLRVNAAEERLAEINEMREKNMLKHMERAENERQKIMERVESESVGLSGEQREHVRERLQKHISVLEQVKYKLNERTQNANKTIQYGIDNAINKSSNVIERMNQLNLQERKNA